MSMGRTAALPLLALIHRSTWKENSAKSICRILYKIMSYPGPMSWVGPLRARGGRYYLRLDFRFTAFVGVQARV